MHMALVENITFLLGSMQPAPLRLSARMAIGRTIYEV